MNGLNDQSVLDARKLITGKDGQLFVTSSKGTNIFLAEVNQFQVQLTVNSTDFQPVGSLWGYKVPTGATAQLTLTEPVVRDDVMITEVLKDIRDGYIPYFQFQGKLRRRDGQEERVVYRDCMPDGTVDLQNISPGEIVARSWTFAINQPPEVLASFATD
jgi:hypothetical protein